MEARVNRCRIVHKPPKLPCIYFELPISEAVNEFKKLEDKSLTGYVLTLKKPRERSLTANSYMWQLCEKIAVRTGVTKEDVYRKAVREVGEFTECVLRSGDAQQLERTWGNGHIGWFTERYDSINTSVALRLYHGSSLYDGAQMRRLVDYVVGEARELGIETMTPSEIERLKQVWQQTDT